MLAHSLLVYAMCSCFVRTLLPCLSVLVSWFMQRKYERRGLKRHEEEKEEEICGSQKLFVAFESTASHLPLLLQG